MANSGDRLFLLAEAAGGGVSAAHCGTCKAWMGGVNAHGEDFRGVKGWAGVCRVLGKRTLRGFGCAAWERDPDSVPKG